MTNNETAMNEIQLKELSQQIAKHYLLKIIEDLEIYFSYTDTVIITGDAITSMLAAHLFAMGISIETIKELNTYIENFLIKNAVELNVNNMLCTLPLDKA